MSKVKHVKGPFDVKRGAAFCKLVNEITVAARLGGSGSSGHPCLRPAIENTTDNENSLSADLRHILARTTAASPLPGAFHSNVDSTSPESILARLDP